MRTLTVDRARRHGSDVQWEWLILTENMPSFGAVAAHSVEAAIRKFVILHPWPLVPVYRGKGFLPVACRVPVIQRRPFAPDKKLLALSDKDVSYLSLGLAVWEQVMGTLSAELQIVLEGQFVIPRDELPLVQVVYRTFRRGRIIRIRVCERRRPASRHLSVDRRSGCAEIHVSVLAPDF